MKVDTYDETMKAIEILGKAFHKDKEAKAILDDIKEEKKYLLKN